MVYLGMPKCATCDKDKEESEFYTDKRATNGLYSSCKKCHGQKSAEAKAKAGPARLRRGDQDHCPCGRLKRRRSLRCGECFSDERRKEVESRRTPSLLPSQQSYEEQLGMSMGSAGNRLRNMIMFDLVQRLGEATCFVCSGEISEYKEMSVEHKLPWRNRDPLLFWDLSNIAFSHRKCNRPHAVDEV